MNQLLMLEEAFFPHIYLGVHKIIYEYDVF